MLPKLVRSDYYNEDYLLNEQEYKEFNFTKVDPYWRLRALLYMFSLNPIGTKEELLRRVDRLLFDNYLYKRAGDEDLRETSDIEIETIINNANVEFEHKDVDFFKKFNEEIVRTGDAQIGDEDIIVKAEFPWEVIKEITRQNRRFTYLEIHRGLTQFMRPTMCFYNHTLDGETLTAIIAFPYTPDMVFQMDKLQIFSLCAAANMLSIEERQNQVKISGTVLRQRLLDAIYAVQDAPRMHSIFPCQSKLKKCGLLASGFDGNYLCKLCCQEDQNRIASMVHDTNEQFFREKLRMLNNFESQFDRRRTIRIQINRLIRRYELEKMFEKYNIEWENLQVFHHLQTQRIEFIYLVCANQAEAFKILQNKNWITNTLRRNNAVISALSNDLSKACGFFGEPEKVVAMVKPPSYLEVVAEMPIGEILFEQLKNVIKVITRLGFEEFTIEPDRNPITEEYDYNQFFVHLPTKAMADRVYQSQPFFGCILVHKITHLTVFPFMRYGRDVCLVSGEERDLNSVWDMNKKASAAQVDVNMVDPCSTNEVAELSLLKKKRMEEHGEGVNLCIKTGLPIPEGSTLCEEYYHLQARNSYDPNYEQSTYWREMKQLTPKKFSQALMAKVASMHLEVREDMKNGRYHWFKPIYGTNIEQSMTKANKDLQEVIDNGHIIRGHAPKKYMKEGRIFTFQGNQPLEYVNFEGAKITENIDFKGNPYLDFNYSPKQAVSCSEWQKSKLSDSRNFSVQDCNLYLNSENLKIRNSFHLMFIGLDKTNLTVKELYQEILIKMQTLVGKVGIKNIMVLDNQSLLADIMQVSKTDDNSKECLKRLGRVACVKFENILDAMCVVTKQIEVTLPLNTGINGVPVIIPSKSFLNYLGGIEAEGTVPYQNAGKMFHPLNKKIEGVTNDIKNILMGGGGDKGGRRRKRRYRKKKKPNVGGK